MALVKCPRCEVNYMRDTDQYCAVCRKEMNMKINADPKVEMCVECGENPALPGKDVCLACYQEGLHAVVEEDPPQSWDEDEDAELEESGADMLDDETDIDLEDVEELEDLEDIALEVDDEIPTDELREIQSDLGMDEEDEEDAEDF